MTNGQKMRKLFEEKKLVVAPGCHDALTAKIISYLGFDAVYMTGYGQSASHLGQPDVGLMTMSEMGWLPFEMPGWSDLLGMSEPYEPVAKLEGEQVAAVHIIDVGQRCQRAAHHPRV